MVPSARRTCRLRSLALSAARVAVALGLLAPTPAVAEPRRVTVGSTVRAVVHRAVLPAQVLSYLQAVDPRGGPGTVSVGDVGTLRGLLAPRVGERYTVLDEGGAVAEVVIDRVARVTTEACAGESYVEASARVRGVIAPPRGGELWAVGPNTAPLARARLSPPSAVARPPRPVSFDRRLRQVIDRDGDHVPDVFVFESYCDGEATTRWGTGPDFCVEVWSARGGTVERVAHARSRVCTEVP